MRNTSLAHLALFAVNLIYGANYVVAKGLMPGVIGPSGFILLRVLGALVLFWALQAWHPQRILWSDGWRFLLCGLTGVAMNQLFFFNGLMRTSPVNASIIMVATPVLVILMSGVLLGERIGWRKVLGIGLGAGGALLLILARPDQGPTSGGRLGDLFVLINAASYALYLVLVKPLMRRYGAVTVMSRVFLVGAVVVLPFGLGELSAVAPWNWSPAIWWSVGFVVVGVTFVAYLLNTWALRHVSPAVVGAYIYLQPVLATLFAWSVLALLKDDHAGAMQLVGWPQVASAAAIFTGVHLVGRANRRPV